MRNRYSAFTLALFLSLPTLAAAGNPYPGSFATPPDAMVQQARQNGPCRDPWVTIALWRQVGPPMGAGDQGDCNTSYYNGGQWNSYSQLAGAIVETHNGWRNQGVNWRLATNSGGLMSVVLTVSDPRALAAAGASVIATGGANIVAMGGANLSAAQKNQAIIATGGANIIAVGGANIMALPVASVGTGYTAQSGALIRLPKGYIRLR